MDEKKKATPRVTKMLYENLNNQTVVKTYLHKLYFIVYNCS